MGQKKTYKKLRLLQRVLIVKPCRPPFFPTFKVFLTQLKVFALLWSYYKILHSSQQDRQCTYYVTLRHIRVTIGGVEKQQVLRILSACL